jgi:hypothetical protein
MRSLLLLIAGGLVSGVALSSVALSYGESAPGTAQRVEIKTNDAPDGIMRIGSLDAGRGVAEVGGTLSSMRDEIRFVFSARSGQHLTITAAGAGPIRGMVISPDGSQSGSPGETFFDESLSVGGDYRILLRESPMGEEWSGRFTMKIELH